MNTFLVFNNTHLYKSTIEYLTAVDSYIIRENNKLVLTLTQTGTLYNLHPQAFATGRFDDNLLNFLSVYRNKISFTFYDRSHTKNTNSHIKFLYLVRVTITNLSSDERDCIGEFVANNLSEYDKFTRQTVSYEKSIDDERVINLKQLVDPNFILKRKNYKDLTLVFGY